MKITCKISGLEFYSSTYFKGEPSISDRHPIFSLPIRSLLARSRKWKNGLYSETERKLLFLALLNSTSAVEWEVPATPTSDTVQKNMEVAFHIAAWIDIANPGARKLPAYRVTLFNTNLSNIGHFLGAIYQTREEWMSHDKRRVLEAVLEQRQFILHKLIHSPYSAKTPSYYSKLASWAIDAASVPLERQEEWKAILELFKPEDIFCCDKDELLDLKDWFERELTLPGSIGMGNGFTVAQEVLAHIRRLVELREGGMLAYLGGELGAPRNTFSIKSETVSLPSSFDTSSYQQEVSTLETQLLLGGIPLIEPKKSDYKDRLSDYLKDRAKWLSASSLRERFEVAKKNLETSQAAERLHTSNFVTAG